MAVLTWRDKTGAFFAPQNWGATPGAGDTLLILSGSVNIDAGNYTGAALAKAVFGPGFSGDIGNLSIGASVNLDTAELMISSTGTNMIRLQNGNSNQNIQVEVNGSESVVDIETEGTHIGTVTGTTDQINVFRQRGGSAKILNATEILDIYSSGGNLWVGENCVGLDEIWQMGKSTIECATNPATAVYMHGNGGSYKHTDDAVGAGFSVYLYSPSATYRHWSAATLTKIWGYAGVFDGTSAKYPYIVTNIDNWEAEIDLRGSTFAVTLSNDPNLYGLGGNVFSDRPHSKSVTEL